MDLTEGQMQILLDLNVMSNKFVDHKESNKIRKEHGHKGFIVEGYQNTFTTCGDVRKQVFGICSKCGIQLYHHEILMALTIIYPINFIKE